jgi:rhamnose transport system substrate-binding protein
VYTALLCLLASPARGQDAPTLYLIPDGIHTPAGEQLRMGAEEAAESLGIRLLVGGATLPGDAAGQAAYLSLARGQNADALLIDPVDADEIAAALTDAVEAGVTVIDLSGAAPDSAASAHLSPPATDEIAAALLVAVGERIGYAGEVALLSDDAALNRTFAGLVSADERFAEVRLIVVEAAAPVEALLVNHPDLRGLIAPEGVVEAGSALRRGAMCDSLILVGVATPNTARPLVNRGCIDAVVTVNPADMGYLAVYAAHALLMGAADAPLLAGRLGQRAFAGGRLDATDALLTLDAATIGDFDF